MANSVEDRYQEAQYRAAAAAYAAKHQHDANKEPEPETEMQRMARIMGLPADGYKPSPTNSYNAEILRFAQALEE